MKASDFRLRVTALKWLLESVKLQVAGVAPGVSLWQIRRYLKQKADSSLLQPPLTAKYR